MEIVIIQNKPDKPPVISVKGERPEEVAKAYLQVLDLLVKKEDKP